MTQNNNKKKEVAKFKEKLNFKTKFQKNKRNMN